MQSKAATVDEFLTGQSASVRGELEQLRTMIRETARHAREQMRYGMPTYTRGVDGPMLCAFNAQKNYLAFYVCHEAVVNLVGSQLPKLKIGKGCIRISSLSEAPLAVLAEALRSALSLAR